MRLERILIADLERRRHTFEPLSAAERRLLGGAALGVTLLSRLCPAGSAALEAPSPWILSAGPLTGTPASPRPQAVITHVSPLTGGVNDSVVTHPLALALAETGTAALVLLGASDTPVWLRLDGDGVAFEDARHLWGLDVPGTAAALGGVAVLAAGPAAEHGVRFACVGSLGHSAGRGGAGAALAAKRVKALAAPAARGAREVDRSLGEGEGREPRGRRAMERLRRLDRHRGLPTRNFSARYFEGTEALAAGLEAIAGSRHLPYEGVFAFGPLLGIADADAVLRCVDLCDRLGMDVISAGGTLAWGIETASSGWLSEPLPRFGDPRGLERILGSLARREGIGDLLAAGCRAAAERTGRESARLAMHVRGLEIPGYDPRAFPTLALGYAVGSRGACHVRSGAYQADFDDPLPDPPPAQEVARRAAEFEDRSTLLDSLILSRSWRAELGEPFEGAARLLREAGEPGLADPAALRAAMREVADLRRSFNLARGWDACGDTLPERLLREEGGSASALSPQRLASWVQAYYKTRGWSADGRPPALGG